MLRRPAARMERWLKSPGDDASGPPDVVISNPAAWLLDEEAMREALVVAAQEQLDPDGTGSIAQGVDPGIEVRPPAETSARGRLTYTVDEAADLLGISRALAYEAVRRGEIPSLRIGRRILVPRSQFARQFGFDPAEPFEPPSGEDDTLPGR